MKFTKIVKAEEIEEIEPYDNRQNQIKVLMSYLEKLNKALEILNKDHYHWKKEEKLAIAIEDINMDLSADLGKLEDILNNDPMALI